MTIVVVMLAVVVMLRVVGGVVIGISESEQHYSDHWKEYQRSGNKCRNSAGGAEDEGEEVEHSR